MEGPSWAEAGGVEMRWPPPPKQYIDNYSRERVAEGTAPAPPPPIQGLYRCFGTSHNTEDDVLPPLSSHNIKTLYSSAADPRNELKQLNRSLIAAFLDLLEILVRCPESSERTRKLNDIRLLFINIHHLINEYRPRQARETLRVMLSIQASERREASRRFQSHLASVRRQVEEALGSLPAAPSLPPALLERVRALPQGRSPASQEPRVPPPPTHQADAIMVATLDQEDRS